MENSMATPGGDDQAAAGAGTIHLPAEMLPKGCAAKEGGILRFKVLGPPDEDGDVPLECLGGDQEPDEDDWEKGFMRDMSPRSDAQPQVPPDDEGNQLA